MKWSLRGKEQLWHQGYMYKDEKEYISKEDIWISLNMTNTAYGAFNWFSLLKISLALKLWTKKFFLFPYINPFTELEIKKSIFNPVAFACSQTRFSATERELQLSCMHKKRQVKCKGKKNFAISCFYP